MVPRGCEIKKQCKRPVWKGMGKAVAPERQNCEKLVCPLASWDLSACTLWVSGRCPGMAIGLYRWTWKLRGRDL